MCSSVSSGSRALLVFCINQGISASFFYFLTVDPIPPGSSLLKEPNSICIVYDCFSVAQLCLTSYMYISYMLYKLSMYTYFKIFFYCGLSQNIESSSLSIPCCLSILYIIVYICCTQTPIPSLPPPTQQPHVYFLYVRTCFCFEDKVIYVIFQNPHITEIRHPGM